MKPTDGELIIGGIAAIALIGLGVVLVAEALTPATSDDTSELEDTSALASAAAVL